MSMAVATRGERARARFLKAAALPSAFTRLTFAKSQAAFKMSFGHGECAELAYEVVEAAKILVELGLNTLTSGNVSARCDKFVVLTPTSAYKVSLAARDLVYFDVERQVFIGLRSPTSEFRMHLAVYAKCEGVGAVAHAHNPLATYVLPSLAAGSESVEETVGKLCVAEKAPPGSQELAEMVSELCRECDVVVLPSHGLVAFGSRPLEAVEKLLRAERAAERAVAAVGSGRA